ncbi:MAG: HEAT repeat domain-containing protein [Planctomycetes bacterium]|nr:HEAT repeat domain-containing protein [Planctomycetota bacterium]
MTPGLMGRLFLVPLLIVGTIIGCAVVVVLLFGGLVSEPEHSIDQLITALERPAGDKTVGVMLPRDKEVWQAAQELAGRLTRADQELIGADRDKIVRRLARIVQRIGPLSADLPEGERQKLAFVMMALARVGQPDALPTLLEQLEAPSAATRRAALMALSYYPDPAELGPYIAVIARSLLDEAVEVQIVACPVVALVADSADRARAFAADRLAERLVDADREVQWNAAVALGRLADRRSKPVLLDMLDRTFWEEKTIDRAPGIGTGRGTGAGHPLPAGRVNVYLQTAMEAAACFLTDPEDPEIREALERLAEDKHAGVRGSAVTLLSSSEADE